MTGGSATRPSSISTTCYGKRERLSARPRIRRMNIMMQGVARQASLDPGDDLGL
ncbi:hypothetical protein [Bradyrhizobium sp. LB12.1]|uniref:hypothetical protein n=1 Tax=Bradyrhizobium sp. LB12.1 TaxID=3156327 RepID=UPI00339A1989